MTRLEAIIQFYDILSRVEKRVEQKRILAQCDGKMKWPHRGVYFFFEDGEERTTSGRELRVVRVGTHAIDGEKNKTTLWGRLRDHRGSLIGQYAGGGNHRGSVFRKHVGSALLNKEHRQQAEYWGKGSSAPQEIRRAEHTTECRVSVHIRSMPFLWVAVNDSPGPQSDRKLIEKDSIALLSNYLHVDDSIDPPSSCWLGRHAHNDKVRKSGLWNDEHVDGNWAAEFLEVLEHYVNAMIRET